MPTKENKKNYKKRILKSKENYSLPEKIVTCIKENQNLQDVLKIIDSVKVNWQKENEVYAGLCLKTLLDRNILNCAAWYGHARVIDYIISKWMTQQQCRKDPNCKWAKNDLLDHVLSLPMFIAAYKKHDTIVKMFARHVTQISKVIPKKKLEMLNYWKSDGVTLLEDFKHIASISTIDMVINNDNMELLKGLHNQLININWKICFYRACLFKAERCAEYMLHNVDELKDVASLKYICENKNVFTPLMIASQVSYKITKMLLEAGVNVNACDGSDRNSLHFAVAPIYLHEEVHGRTYNGKVKKCDRPSAVCIKAEKNADFFTRRIPSFRCWSINEETVKIVNILLEYGIDKTLVGRTLNDRIKRRFLNKLNSTLDPVQFGDEQTLNPLGVLIYQISVVSFHSGSCFNGDIASTEKVKKHLAVIDQLMTCTFAESATDNAFTSWYYATLIGMLNCSCIMIHFKDDDDQEILNNLNISHAMMELCLTYSCFCLKKLLELSSTSEVCPLNEFGVDWLIMRMVPVIGRTNTKVPLFQKLFREILKLYYAYGYSLADNLDKPLKNILKVAHRKESVLFVPDVLSLLCTLPHYAFYKAVAILDEIPSRVCNSDASYWDSEEEEDEPVKPDDFIKDRCMYSEIKALNLEGNPRPLAHLARLAIYELMGRRFEPDVIFSSSKIIQEYITGFEY